MSHSISRRRHQFSFPTIGWPWPIVLVAFIGLLDASYLTYTHYSGELVGCSMQSGCDDVLSSPFSTFNEIPVSLLGSIYYATMIGLAFASSWGWKMARNLMKVLTLMAFLASCYLVYLQLFVIHAICQYCMLSFGVSTVLFLMTWLSSQKQRLAAT